MSRRRHDPRLQPFRFGRRGPPVLLVHGFTGSPFEMRFLGVKLARRGFRTVGVRLPGHGLNPYALERAAASDWVNEARSALLTLSAGEPAFVCGLSMGALIASILAADHPERVRALALCAPALRLQRGPGLLVALARLLSRGVRFVEKRPSALFDERMRARVPNIGFVPALAATQFEKVQVLARLALPKVAAPALVVYSTRDGTVRPEAALECAELIGSRPARLVRLERSSHVLTLDLERERVADEIEHFFRALN